MPIVKAQVEFQDTSNLPEDRYINTFYFQKLTAFLTADYSTIGQALTEFYVANTTTGWAVQKYLAGHIVTSPAPWVKYYEVPAGGSPVGESQLIGFAPNSEGRQNLPAEVALCLTYHASLVGVPEEVRIDPPGPAGDDRPRARRRGRLYVGPLNNFCISTLSGAKARPDNVARDTMAEAARRLVNRAALATAGIDWVVYSKREGIARKVVGGWVDDAFDTQRRRGTDASTRRTWAAA